MKKTLTIILSALLLPAFTSCIQDEPLNAECDIESVDSTWINANKGMLIGNPIVTNDHVSFTIQKGTDRSALAPRFNLTEGARITMLLDGAEVEANGATRDFSSPQTYTVHSQDGLWQKDYNVSFSYPQALTLMSFEHYELDSKGRYQQWYETDATDQLNPRRDYWSNGNAGYAFTGQAKTPDAYPTVSEPLGYQGNCVRLTTLSTGSFGELVKTTDSKGNSVPMAIAAGSIFIGEFNSRKATSKPREATKFGLQLVGGKPVSLEGYYKYTAGTEFTIGKVLHPELHDTADIYAVVYEVDPANFEPLDGNNVLTSDRIVMMARIANPGEPAEWTRFSEPFRLLPGKEWSEERVRTDGYAIAVVATSSRQGAYFEGAVGSELWVDELKVNWEE